MSEETSDLFEWAQHRKSAVVIDAIPLIALRMWARREWPKPQQPCTKPIAFEIKRGAA